RVGGRLEEAQNAVWNVHFLVIARGVDDDPGADGERDPRDLEAEVHVQVGSEAGRVDDDDAQGVDIQQRGIGGANVGTDAQGRSGEELESARVNVQEKRAQHLDKGGAAGADGHIAGELDVDQERVEVEPHRISRVARVDRVGPLGGLRAGGVRK